MKLLAFETSTEACSVALWLDGAVHERFELAPRRHAELALPWAEQLLAQAGVAKAQLDAIAVSRGPGAFTGVRLGVAIAQGIALALDRPVLPVSTLAALALPPLRSRGGLGWGAPGMELQGASTQPPPGLPVLPGVLHRTNCSQQFVNAAHHPLPSQGEEKILAAIDARMGEVYFAAFQREGDGLRLLQPEVVAKPDAIALPEGDGWLGVGTGFSAVDGALRTRLGARLAAVDASALPHAADVARLAALAFARGEAVAPERLEPAYLRDNVALTLAEQQALREKR